MNRQTIEKEGRNIALSDLTLVGLNERAIALKYFAKGADWRINSVWHDASRKPNKNKLILFECRKEYGKGYSVTFGDNYQIIKSVLIRWTYIDDILPEGKEEER